jgi:hypothetical protein
MGKPMISNTLTRSPFKARAAAIAKLRELAPDLPSPTFGDALLMLCHCGEKLNEDCKCGEGEP